MFSPSLLRRGLPSAAAIILFVAGVIGGAVAAAEGPLTTTLKGFVVSAKDGKETLAPAETAPPGQVMEYAITAANSAKSALKKVQVVGPVPKNTAYVEKSAQKADLLEVSIDDGKTFAKPPIKRTVTGPDGKSSEIEVDASEYTHLRWTLPEIKGGASQELRYRVRVK